MKLRNRRWPAMLVVLGMVCLGCRRQEMPAPPSDAAAAPTDPAQDDLFKSTVTRAPASGYVGEEACASCHASVARTYRDLGMAKAFYRPSEDNIIEDFENNHFYHPGSDQHYEMTHRDNRFYVTRYQQDDDGTRYNELEQEITYVLGSGHHSRGYVYMNDAGEMFQMPIAWYTQEHRWDMAPGYDNPLHENFSRPVTRSCMFCHNAYPDVAEGSDQAGQPHRFPAELPEGIGCQRCHGPGAQHVRVASDESSSLGQVRSTIINPGNMDPQQQNDTCMQCHLQPSSKLTSFARRFGRGDYSYVPGQPLDEYLVHFDFETDSGDADVFEIDSSAYRLMQSTCYASSAGAMTCLTCHDPHRRIPKHEKSAYYRDRCFTCHTIDSCAMEGMTAGEHETPADDCVACHMPQRRTDDVVHVVMTDHKIQRLRPEGDLLGPLSETLPPQIVQTRFLLPQRAPTGPEAAVYLTLPELKDGSAGALDRFAAALNASVSTAIEPLIELGAAELTQGRFADALSTWTQILDVRPDLASAHVNRGVALAGLGRSIDAMVSLDRAIELDPDSPDAHYNFASVLAWEERSEEALEQYGIALRLRPNHAKGRFNLGNLLARMNRLDDAAVEFRQSLAIDPDQGDVYANLGTALSHLGRLDEALTTWRRGSRRLPHDGRLSHKMARVLLAATDPLVLDFEAGLAAAIQAARADQSNPDYALTVSFALLVNERYKESLAVATQAKRLGAVGMDCALITAIGLHELQLHDAEGFYRRAIASPDAARSSHAIRRALLARAQSLFEQPADP